MAGAHEPGEAEPPVEQRTAPVLLQQSPAAYPEAARRAGVGGTVSLEIVVAADGSVADVKVLRGVGFGLDEAAVAVARTFRFQPATDGGKPVSSTVRFDQRFTLR